MASRRSSVEALLEPASARHAQHGEHRRPDDDDGHDDADDDPG
jgi:hypothetical protein